MAACTSRLFCLSGLLLVAEVIWCCWQPKIPGPGAYDTKVDTDLGSSGPAYSMRQRIEPAPVHHLPFASDNFT